MFNRFINISGDEKERDVGTLSHGKYFGELALLKEDTRQATVTAMPPGAECLVLDRGYVPHSMSKNEHVHERGGYITVIAVYVKLCEHFLLTSQLH
jgi:CRP-like cAMP-binding protein